jgi:hypothetical protein
MGSILDLAKRDAKRFVTKGGFEVDIEMITPTKDKVINITGLGTKHWINFDSDGNPINSKNVHICIDEEFLNNNSYPTRNGKGEIRLLNHLITFKDSSGIDRNYIVKENFPDETLGLIVCILADYTI